jgi:hypothetical protein
MRYCQNSQKGTKVKSNVMGKILSFPAKELRQCKTEEQWRKFCEENNVDPIIVEMVIEFAEKHNFEMFHAYQCLAGLCFIKFCEGEEEISLENIIKNTL